MAKENGELIRSQSTCTSREKGVTQAAWQFEDSIMEHIVHKYPREPAARNLHIEVIRAEILYNRALLAMLVLTVFETPAWCDTHVDVFNYIGASERCAVRDSEGGKIVPMLSGIAYCPPLLGCVVEVVLMAVLANKFILERKLQLEYFEHFEPKVEYISLKKIYCGAFFLVFELVDIVVFVLVRPRWRLAFVSRTGYLCLLPAVKKLFDCICAVIGQFASVAVFFLGVIVFFAWIAMVGLRGVEEGGQGFQTFGQALNTMFIAGVCDEFVAVLLSSYTHHRPVGLVWLLFIALAHVLMLSVVLDTLVAAFKDYNTKEETGSRQKKVKGMLKAFTTLRRAFDSSDEVSKEGFLEFIKEFSRSPRMVPVKADNAEILFKAIDKDNSEMIDREEFCDICGVIQFQFWSVRKFSFVKYKYPHIWEEEYYQSLVRWVDGDQSDGHGDFDVVMNYVLLLNLLLVGAETFYDLYKLDEPAMIEWLELAFSLIYVGEVGVKLSVYSWENYRSSPANLFDFMITWLLLISCIVQRLFEGNLATYMNMIRLLRLVRVVKKNLKNNETAQFMIRIITKLIFASTDMMTLLGVVVFFFTTLSVQVFGGELFEGNESLEGSEYAEQNWWVLNCNDVPGAFGLWIVMLLQEYQPNFPDAVSRVSGLPGSWIIFPIFYVAGVSVVFELVKAFTIEVFMKLKEEDKKTGEGEPGKDKNTLENLLETFEKALGADEQMHLGFFGDSSTEALKEELGKMDAEIEEENEDFQESPPHAISGSVSLNN